MQLVGESYTADKTGAATATVSYLAERGESSIFGSLPGTYRGLIITKAESKQQEDGSYIATGTYEGQTEEGPAGGGATYGEREGKIYEWSPTFEQTDIAKHPRISELLERYEGEEDESGNVVWPKNIGGESGGGLGEQSEQSVNPMYGVTEFLSLGGIWSETSLQGDIPPDVFSSIGVTTSEVPGGISTPENRFWLTMPPIVIEHGNRWKVTRRWMLSGIASARDVEAANDIYGAGLG
jgi:hypothetical protein